jgi:branched-chain amino acid transport system permease protein
MRLLRDSGATIATLVILLASLAVPYLTDDPFTYSVLNQVAIGFTAAVSVYLMLRMDLLTFAVPAFMAIGGYATAIASLRWSITDTILLTVLSFAVAALVALPLGILVLRLRGVYFVLVTFLLSQITQLVLFETPGLTGGSNGLVGMPSTTLFGTQLGDNQSVLVVALAVALLAAMIAAATARIWRKHFAAIEENEVLAQSLGLVVWRYKVLGFVVAAGLAGMAGFSLVNMLLTAHPSSFGPASAVNYIAYAIIGGRASMLGTLIGSTLLVWLTNLFSSQGAYSQGLFGLLLMVVVLGARGGIVGLATQLVRRARAPAAAARSPNPAEKEAA